MSQDYRILLVEDEGYRIDFFRQTNIGREIDVTKDPNEAIRWLNERTYDEINLDHDLSEHHYAVWREARTDHDAETGYAVAKYLAENPHLSPNAKINVHSLNPHGRRRMVEKMSESRKDVTAISIVHLMRLDV